MKDKKIPANHIHSGGITEAQIFLTRECNLSCGYCKLVSNSETGGNQRKELDLAGWMQAFSNMAELGIKTVKILGGEPTVKPWLPELIEYSGTVGIKTALLSNSTFDDEMLRRLAEVKLYGYYASVDGLSELHQYDSQTGGKAKNGYAMLRRIRCQYPDAVPLLAANVVIHRKNIDIIPELVQRLSDEGIFVNLCIIQHTDDPNREFSRIDISRTLRFTPNDRDRIGKLGRKLTAMKQAGCRIAVPERYLVEMASQGIDCSWQCGDMVQLRIDSDGGIMLCNEYRTALADEFNITAMRPGEHPRLHGAWQRARKSLNCRGCYWSCFIQAEENLKGRRFEFDFSGGT